MIYSEIGVKKMLKDKNLSVEDEINLNILNFIRVIYLNKQDFINSSFASEYYGELPMTFRKKAGQVMGVITATVDGVIKKFIFNDKGYEPLENLIKLTEE